MQITLLRHGKPNISFNGFLKGRYLKDFAESYQQSVIIDIPPENTLNMAKQNNIIVCSSLARSINSAKALDESKILTASEVFQETKVPHCSSGSISLPIKAWIVIHRFAWLLGYSHNGESFSATKQRAKLAANELIRLANEYKSVLLVGHGLMNFFIARVLIANNWTGPFHPGSKHWSYGVYNFNGE